MCGICGIVNLNDRPVSSSRINRMMQAQKHRGPDDDGIFTDKHVGLGFVRLSILDLSLAGHQPMYSSDGNLVVVFNGEIFNYIELREELKRQGYQFNTGTDTEVLLNAYIHWGKDCLHRFNGMWAFAIYNRTTRELFIARDRYGIKPLYWVKTDDFFAFASEIPSLLSILPNRPKANMQTVFDFLVFNRTDQNDETFFEGISKLLHGRQLTLSARTGYQPNPEQWYNLEKEVQKHKALPLDTEGFRNLFVDAVRIRLRSDVPVGVCLSGGLDSSSIVSTLTSILNRTDIDTFSAVYGKGEYGDESEFIAEYRNQIEAMHFTKPSADSLWSDLDRFIEIHAEPIPSTGPYAQFKVMDLARKHDVVVTLDGQGADEMLAGYHYFFGFFFKDLLLSFRWFKLLSELFHYLKNHRSAFGIKTFILFLLPKKLRTKTRIAEKNYLNPSFANRYSKTNSIAGNLYGADSLNQALINHFEYKLEHLLKWEDRNSMAFSIEARVPFLDHRLVEALLASDGRNIIKKGVTKIPLREAMRGILPEKIRTRSDKVGFDTPQDSWFRTPRFKQFVLEIIRSDSFRKRNIIDSEKAEKLYLKHLSGKANLSKEIWKWIHLELWFRKYID